MSHRSARSLGRLAMFGLLALFAFAAPVPARADPFRVVAFAGSSNWPFWVAEAKGFFHREALDVTLDITPNSVEMAKNLSAGHYDLALTSIDNVVAYDEGQGEADLGGPAQFVALFGVDDGLLNVVTAPGITSFAALKGKTLSVDALTTGFAFVLRDALARHGLEPGDISLVRVGGGAQRLDALLQGRTDGTLLNTPLDLLANAKGFNTLVHIRDELGAYQGIVGATTRAAMRTDQGRLAAFIRAFATAVAWLREPEHRQEGTAILAARMRMDLPAATRAYEVLLAPNGGISRDLKIDQDGVRTVLALRSRYAEHPKSLTDPGRYMDDSIRQDALGR